MKLENESNSQTTQIESGIIDTDESVLDLFTDCGDIYITPSVLPENKN